MVTFPSPVGNAVSRDRHIRHYLLGFQEQGGNADDTSDDKLDCGASMLGDPLSYNYWLVLGWK